VHWLDLFQVLRADKAKQNYSVMPRLFYFPRLKTCRRCGGVFVFSAKEQKYWYEDLKFYVDSTAVECVTCRKQKREGKTDLERYTEGVNDKMLEDSQLVDLAVLGMRLLQVGVLKRDQSVREVLNRIRDKQRWQSEIDSCRSRLCGGNIG
jgi:hypothetical protein